MRRKTIYKIVISVLCVSGLLIGSIFDKAALVTQASQNQERIGSQMTPEDMGYERVTVDEFNISDDIYEANSGMTYGYYRKGDSLKGKYLDVDVTTNATGGTTSINYGGSIAGGWYGVGVLVLSNAIQFKMCLNEGSTAPVSIKFSDLKNMRPTDTFNLKIAVTTKGKDVVVDAWVNNVYQEQMTFTGCANEIGNWLGIYAKDQGITIDTPTFTKELGAVSYNLDQYDTGYLITTSGKAYVNGVEYADISIPLSTPGNYEIRKVEGRNIYIQQVALYRVGDVDLNGICGEQSDYNVLRDILLGRVESVAGERAGDLNNDGQADLQDLELLEQIANGNLDLAEVIAKYHVPAEAYDFLGGNEVMPITGFHGPYNARAHGENGEALIYNYLNDDIFKMIADSGINIISQANNNYMHGDYVVETALELAEKYGLGMLVTDSMLYDSAADGTYKNMKDLKDITARIGKYSQYDSFLGLFLCDEPYTEEFNTYGRYVFSGEMPELAAVKNFHNYLDIANRLNGVANLQGYINLLSYSETNYPNSLQGWFGITDATKAKTAYNKYMNLLLDSENGANSRVLSFDKYQFTSADSTVVDAENYFNALDVIRVKAQEKKVPFWSHVQLGGDFRDGSSTEATNQAAIPTEAETYWQINMPLAFGAKGIEYFTLIQPYHFSYDDESGVADCSAKSYCTYNGADCGHGHDFDRNGLIGANGQPTKHYAYAKKANKQIAAVDEVLMKANSKGVVAAGQHAVNNIQKLGSAISGTQILNRVDVSSGYGAVVGCFDYKDTEAYYVVNYDVTDSQDIALGFSVAQSYMVIADGEKTVGTGDEVLLHIGPGEGVLVVCNAKKTEKYVYFEDISPYRGAKSSSNIAPVMEGYLFAGWFKSDTDTASPIAVTRKSGSAYAKFVDADLLNVKAQVRYKDLNNIGKMDIRFIATVDGLRYQNMGFQLAYDGKNKDYMSDSVYQTISAWEEDQQDYKVYTPKDLCLSAEYFKAYTLWNVPIESFHTPIQVAAYWKTLDGTIVTGKSAVKRVYEGIKDLTSPEDYGYEKTLIDDFGVIGNVYSEGFYNGTYTGNSLENKYLDVDLVLSDNGQLNSEGSRVHFAAYERITLEDFGIKSGQIQNTSPYGSCAGAKTLNGKYLDVDITLPQDGTDAYFNYGGSSQWTGIQFQFGAEQMVVQQYHGTGATGYSGWQEISYHSVGAQAGDTINLKVATTVVGSRTLVDIWVNNVRQVRMTVEGNTDTMGNAMGIWGKTKGITLTTPDVEVEDYSEQFICPGLRIFVKDGVLYVQDEVHAYVLERYGIKAGERFNLKISIKDVNYDENTCTIGLWINDMFVGCKFQTYADMQIGNSFAIVAFSPNEAVTVSKPTK